MMPGQARVAALTRLGVVGVAATALAAAAIVGLPSGSAQAALLALGATPSATPTPSADAGTGASASPSPSPTDAATPTDTPTATVSPSPSATPSPTSSWVQVLTIDSTDQGRSSRTVWVYRPAVPDAVDLPVLYLLHGQYGGPADPFNAGMKSALDALFASGVTPFVVAVPDGSSMNRSDDEWGDAADGADLLETFLSRDVIPAVEGDHPRDRMHRAIAGFSMGGYAAAFTGELHQGAYGQLISLAGYFHPDDPQGVFPSSGQRWAHYPLGRAWTLAHTRVLLLDCSNETDPVIRGEIYRMREVLARSGHRPGAVVTSGNHGWIWVQSLWPRVARFLSEGWGQSR